MANMFNKLTSSQAFILPSLLLTSMFVVVIGLIITSSVVANFSFASLESHRVNSQFAVDAGIDRAITELNQDDTWLGTGGEITLLNQNGVRTTYQIVVEAGAAPDEKILYATGRAYRGSSETPEMFVSYAVELYGIGGNTGTISVATGVGGLYMTNSAKIVDGAVVVNGELSMANSSQIGLVSNPVSLSVAHQNCPLDGGSTYPQVCTSGQPISISNPARIYGDVCATNQTNDNRMSHGGLITGCTAEPQPLPVHDRQAVIDAITTNISGDLNCGGQSTTTIQANTRITGNLTMSNSCKVFLNGNVWIGGNFSMSNSSQLIPSDGLGTTMTEVMVDGSNGITLTNAAEILANSSGVGVMFVTYHSTAGCSPGCESVTGADLFNSRTVQTISLANNVKAPSSILYARWTQASLNNGGDVGAVAGQTVRLANSAAVTFGASLGSSEVSQRFWLVSGYRRVY